MVLQQLETIPGLIICRYPLVRHLAHKHNFQRMMGAGLKFHKALGYAASDFDFIPQTFIFPGELDLFKEFAQTIKNPCWISKPVAGSMGDSCIIFKNLKQFSELQQKEVVVQRYIDNPLLVDGLKFDLRLYVIITGIHEGDIHAYIADEGLARFCTEEYEPVSTSNLKKYYMHLTNYSVNKGSPNFIGED